MTSMPDSDSPGVDAHGQPVRDPTENVLGLVDAAVQRLDDLRDIEARHDREVRDREAQHVREVAEIRAEYERERADIRAAYDAQLRAAETARIDAIRAVDIAVNRAAEVSATQAATLAAQVTTSAETLRASVVTAATAAATALSASLEPIMKDIADLRRVQYEQVGQRTQVAETRDVRGMNLGAVYGGISIALVIIFGVLGIALARG